MTAAEATSEPIIYVVDDNDDVRETLALLFESVDLPVATFASARAFLDSYPEGQPGCLIADVRMPEMSGMELQQEMKRRAAKLPVIIITGYGDIDMAVRAMKEGAIDFIEKPYKEQELLDRVQKAIDHSLRQLQQSSAEQTARQRLDLLSPREREVLTYVVAGEPNKRIAHQLSLSEKTVEFHRANIMKKLQAKSLADLVRQTLIAEQT